MTSPTQSPPSQKPWMPIVLVVGILVGGYFLSLEIKDIVTSNTPTPAGSPSGIPNAGAGELNIEETNFTSEIKRQIDARLPAIRQTTSAADTTKKFEALETDLRVYLRTSKGDRNKRLSQKGVSLTDIAALESRLADLTESELSAARATVPLLSASPAPPLATPPPVSTTPPVNTPPTVPPPADRDFDQLESEIIARDVVGELAPFTTPGVYDTAMGRSINDLDPKPVSFSAIKGSGALEPSMDGLYKLYLLVTDSQDRIRPRWRRTHRNRGDLEQDLDARSRLRLMQNYLSDYGATLVKMDHLSP